MDFTVGNKYRHERSTRIAECVHVSEIDAALMYEDGSIIGARTMGFDSWIEVGTHIVKYAVVSQDKNGKFMSGYLFDSEEETRAFFRSYITESKILKIIPVTYTDENGA